MSFNIDDPLAGILSDGSDDSFFDDDILGKKKPQKKNESNISEKKNSFFDSGDQKSQSKTLVGEKSLQKDADIEEKAKFDNLKTTSPTPFKKAVSKESIFQQIDASKSPGKPKLVTSADIVPDDIGIHPKKDMIKPLDKGKSSQSLLDDILGGSSNKIGGSNQTTRPTTGVKKQQFDLDTFLDSESRQTAASTTKVETQKPNTKTENVKEAAKSRKAKSNDDWLGIFQEKDSIMEEEEVDDVPAWLGGSGQKKKKNIKEPKTETRQIEEEQKGNPKVTEEIPKNTANVENYNENVTKNVSNLDISQEDITMQGTALYLQQQESQLMVALQLKAQDEKLAAMQLRQKESQRVQREAVLAQHEQVDAMLRRQADHRKQMQAIIAVHQERITQRIKDLLGDAKIENEETQEDNIETEGGERKESPFAKERKQLLQLVQSLQDNHDKEIDLMETSYRRQLAFLEVSFHQSEERMKEESDKIVRFYSEKITWLDEHHQLYKKMCEENLVSLTERHKAENDMLRQQHLENIKTLQEHHATLMENVKNAVKQEQVLIRDSASFSLDLQELLTQVKDGNVKSTRLYEKVEILSQNSHRDSDRSLQIRETQISDMIQQLKTERENFEKEKSESKEIVNMLEARLKQMTSMIEEESSSLRQKKMEFEFEKATFSKQTEFAKNILKKQDEEIKMMKDEIQKEYREKISRIEEEKAKSFKESASVAKEKASIQSLKLELERMKAELQAQLEETSEERSKLNSQKQELQIEEQRVLSKSRDLDLLAKTAMEKQSQADKKFSEAEFLQRKYEDRIRRIQEHVVSLNTREKQIAKEKVALSRERLSLHNERKEIEGRQQCSLCRTSQYADHAYVPSYLPVSRDYLNIGSPVNVIEAEMAQLMGRVRQDVTDAREGVRQEPGAFKDYMDPKLMMLRLDVQQVIGNLDLGKKDENEHQGV
ncbi:fas-binding factor 1 homolog [Nymphalis io]|uniref:fas-binding factor 1 homolog n=1 Tax=Inachis io TaxID=171585 RepID=UPI002167C265|nr:fas-binding factor 1 homolog [Nymphalis io]